MNSGPTSISIPGIDLTDDEPLTPAALRILKAASELFYWHGIHAVGVERIARDAGVTKKTIFDRFGSKDRLTAAYLRRRDVAWRERLREAIADHSTQNNPKRTILASFDALENWVADENPRGCAFVNAFAEITSPEHPGYQVIIAQKTWLASFFAELCKRGGAANPGILSEQLMVLYEGATVVNSMRLAEFPVRSAKAIATTLIDAHFQAST